MMRSCYVGCFAAFLLLVSAVTAQTDSSQVFQLTSVEFKQKIDNGDFAALIDVRTATEFAQGHIANATLMENLASFGTSDQVATPNELMGCELCDLGVYCRSGSRAAAAITVLQENGFKGRLYNGLGVNQWTDQGYPLVTDTISTPALCATTVEGQEECRLSYLARTGNSTEAIPMAPVMAPSVMATPVASPVMAPVAESPASSAKQVVLATTMLTGLIMAVLF